MAVHYIVTGSRYAIVKYQGCSTIYSATYASLLLVSIWTVLWSIVALIFAVLTLITFFRKRKDVKDILLCTNSGLNIKRFARLLIFSFLIVFAMIPLSLYYFVSQAEVLKILSTGTKFIMKSGMLFIFMILDFSHFMTDWSTVFFLFLLLLYLDWVQMHLTCINPCFIKCTTDSGTKDRRAVFPRASHQIYGATN